jgi:arylsulfatase A-like enzyme
LLGRLLASDRASTSASHPHEMVPWCCTAVQVHWPLEAPDEYMAKYASTTGKDARRQHVCAMAKIMDDGVGNVTAALKASGAYDTTVQIFSSDNVSCGGTVCQV